MAVEIPKVGLVMENARLVRWLKNVGDVVKQGDPLVEVETEKSVVEIESTDSGRLVEILLQADQEARVGDRIAWLDNGAAETAGVGAAAAGVAPTAAAAPRAAVGSVPTAAAPRVAVGSAPPASAAPEAAGSAPSAAHPTTRIMSSPVARRLAAENCVDLKEVTGTGPRGRIQLIDVRRSIATPAAEGAATTSPAERQPLSSMRRAVARSMTLSNATVPQFTVERAVDWAALRSHRAQFLAELPAGAPKLSVNDFLLQAIARTLLCVPELNATFSGDPDSPDACIVPARGAHIGLVVAVENGLLVPVFHDVEQFGLAELARRRAATVERALQGKLKREELEGATFSVSNLGRQGPDRFNAIINPPQSAILAVGRERDCVVAVNGAIQVRPLSQLTLTADHRVADGRLAADFLNRLVEILEGDTWRLN